MTDCMQNTEGSISELAYITPVSAYITPVSAYITPVSAYITPVSAHRRISLNVLRSILLVFVIIYFLPVLSK